MALSYGSMVATEAVVPVASTRRTRNGKTYPTGAPVIVTVWAPSSAAFIGSTTTLPAAVTNTASGYGSRSTVSDGEIAVASLPIASTPLQKEANGSRVES